jgi:uncharacterized protein YndB with AHSA1/START domain
MSAAEESTSVPDAADAPAWRIGRRVWIPAPRERVWEALTRSEGLGAWLCDDAALDLREGGKLSLSGPTLNAPRGAPGLGIEGKLGGPIEATIVALAAPERFAFRWRVLGVETLVDFGLDTHLEQTILRVLETSGERVPWSDAPRNPNWWWVALPAIRSLVEKGAADLRLDYAAAARAERLSFELPVATFPWVIWSKLTKDSELGRWLAAPKEIDLARGIYSIDVPECGGARGVLELEDGARLVLDWHWPTGPSTRVEWRIEPTEDDDTIVRVTDHGPYDGLTPSERLRRALFWASALLHLQQLSQRGISSKELELAF